VTVVITSGVDKMIRPNFRVKNYGRGDSQLHSFGILALDGDWSALCSGCFTYGVRDMIPTEQKAEWPQGQSGHFRKLITSVDPARNQL
jgi:hypothetical protein